MDLQSQKRDREEESDGQLQLRKEKKAATNENDEGSEADEESESENDAPVRKKRRNVNPYIEDMAMDDDNEDDESEGDEGLSQDEDFDEINKADQDDSRHRDLDRRKLLRDDQDANEIAADLRERYRKADYGMYKGAIEHVPQRLLIPSVNDPKLWLVRCKPGKERAIVQAILRKHFALAESGTPLEILSVFQRDSLAGYVYVEAMRKASVSAAIEKIAHLYGSKLTLVEVSEMVDCLSVKRRESGVENGVWVRIKRGKYLGDIAQVFEQDNEARIKIVPRLDYDVIKGEAKKKRSARPPAALFNVDSVVEKRAVDFKSGIYFYNGDEFNRKGYLEKNVKLSTLDTVNVAPTLDEVSAFFGGVLTSESQSLLALAQKQSEQTEDFQVGAAVQVTRGGLKNMLGTVVSVQGRIVTVRPNGSTALDKREIELSVSDIKKVFEEGQHVRITSGQHANQTGLITHLTTTLATLLTDTSPPVQIQVFLRDLRSIHDSSHADQATSVVIACPYDLLDLVTVGERDVGVVLAIDGENIVVYSQEGTVQSHKVQMLRGKVNTRMNMSIDADGIAICYGDLIQVQLSRGEREQCGNVIHICRGHIFCQSREIAENNGVFVTRSMSVNVLSNKSMLPPSRPQQFQQGFQINPAHIATKAVMITKGPYKGYLGFCKHATTTEARVELHTSARMVSVPLDAVEVVDRDGRRIGNGGSSRPGYQSNANQYGQGNAQGGFDGGKTPMYGSGSKTPMHGGFAGGKTPACINTPKAAYSVSGPTASTPRAYPISTPRQQPQAYQVHQQPAASVRIADIYTPLNAPFVQTPRAYPVTLNPPPAVDQPLKDWILLEILVTCISGPHLSSTGAVKLISGESCEILTDAKETVVVFVKDLQPVKPEKKSRVKVLMGEFRGASGLVIGIDGEDGIVKIDGSSDFKIIRMSVLAKIL